MQSKAQALKRQLEEELGERVPAALSPAVRTEKVRMPLAHVGPTNLLNGGVPVGAITEVHGVLCSGKTSFALSLSSAVTQSGSVAAWVDTADTFDPETAALSGVDLDRLLWVRCGFRSSTEQLAAPKQTLIQAETSDSPKLVSANYKPKPVGNGGCGSPHPRGEGRGMAEAIDTLLVSQPRSAAIKQRRLNKTIGTPGAPNRSLTATGDVVPTGGNLFGRQTLRAAMPFPHASPYREEQIATDRQPSRRAKSGIPFQAQSRPPIRGQQFPKASDESIALENRWSPLDQALRSVDLLLQAGGFSLIVLDLGHVAADMAWRIPLATWFRFRASCERSRTSLLVLSQHPCARASADLTVGISFDSLKSVGTKVVAGSSFNVRVEQQRRGAEIRPVSNLVPFRKPVRSDGGAWVTASPWSVRA